MLTLPGYTLADQIYKGKRSWVFRAFDSKHNRPVIVKVNSKPFPSLQELHKFQRDFDVGTQFDSPYITKYFAIEPLEQRLAIVKEDFDAISLAEMLPSEGFKVLDFLSIGLKMVAGLADIHAAQIIHKDIKPRNILLNPDLSQVKYIDFGLSVDIHQQSLAAPPLEGSLAYMSPEQTGRMNRNLDYRTDFYSLGATFYEMLTGQLPFDTTNSLELIHFHIAKTPLTPHTVRASVPIALSNIVMKLLAKNPVERYQSSSSLNADLQHYLANVQNQAGSFYIAPDGQAPQLTPAADQPALSANVKMENPGFSVSYHSKQIGQIHQSVKDSPESYQIISQPIPEPGNIADTIHLESLDYLDLLTVIKASQTISSEINLERLLSAMMKIIIESAGAQIGYLILEQAGVLCIDAAINLVTGQIELLQSTPVKNHPNLAESIVRYVAKHNSQVVIHNGSEAHQFGEDKYLATQKPKSILCIPLKHQDKAWGVLYLENNLSTHAFTQTRVEILKILAAQASISLENAYLYRDLTQEIVERHKIEEALRTSEERLTLATTATQLGIWDWDITSNEISWSDNFEEIFHIAPDTFLGTPATYMELIHPDDRDIVDKAIAYALKGNPNYHLEHRTLGTDKQIYWIESFGRVFFDDSDQAIRMIGTVQDVTARKRAEESLQAYTNELERSNKELRAFAYVSSHDLQEPLRKIQTLGNRLRGKYHDILDDQGIDYLERMEGAAARMRNLIDDLLAFSRITNSTQSFHPVDLTISALEAISDLESYIQKVKGNVNLDNLPTIQADETQMRQMFLNLVSNGLKFHKPGQPPVVEIKGQLQQAGTVCQITISDKGIGFDEKYLERIFTVFQRLHDRDTFEGTGVGLAICRKITDRHHGTITAKSILNQGTTFIVTLPVQQPNT